MRQLILILVLALLGGCTQTLTGDPPKAGPSDSSFAPEPAPAPVRAPAGNAPSSTAPASSRGSAVQSDDPPIADPAGSSEASGRPQRSSSPSDPAAGSVAERFACQKMTDCTSTCDSGCVNAGWARKHQDTCVNIRAFDCSCVSSVCYTDGNAPR